MFKRLSAALIGSILFCIISISSGGISASKNSVQSISSNNGKTMIACNIQKIDNRDKYIESLSKDDLETQRRLNQYMDAAANNNNFHGEVLVEKGSRILLSKGYGMADYEKSIPNTSSTKLAIGSITKQFTSMAVMQLYEKGKLKLTDKLNKFFKDFPRGNEISIHQLLSHTSGIVNYTQLEEFYKLAPEDLKSDNIIKLLYNKPLDFEPGQSWNYSNSNYLLLSKIIEKLSGMSLEEYMEKNIFKPLDMKNTGACFSKGKIRLSAKGYTGYLD
ncbi:MAG: serine hydrolase domain-containing protein, partial [Bacillota bacterium]|nr:serine hydrolase domain-containing protein [Bacillota bacterium]